MADQGLTAPIKLDYSELDLGLENIASMAGFKLERSTELTYL